MKERALRLDHEPVVVAATRLPPPILTWAGGREWRLEAPYAYRDGETTITVPAGFLFDLSSVPRIWWWLIAPFELSVVAPLVHDFLYRHAGRPPVGAVEPPRTYTRAEADATFLRIMELEGVAWWRRTIAHAAVRLFGRDWPG